MEDKWGHIEHEMVGTKEGIIQRHYLMCPYCGSHMDLAEKLCSLCGAKPLYVVWMAGSPELALVGRRLH